MNKSKKRQHKKIHRKKKKKQLRRIHLKRA